MFSETAGWSSVHFYKVLISNCLRIPSGWLYEPTPMSTLWQFVHCASDQKEQTRHFLGKPYRLGSLGLQYFAYLYQPADECRFVFAGYPRNT